MFKLVEPNEEVYCLWVNEKQFSMFDLFYTDAGYKTISGEPIKNFKNRHGYFIIYKEDKTISFTNVIEFTGYQDKEYFLIDLINKVDRRIDRMRMISEQVKELRNFERIYGMADFSRAICLMRKAADTIETLSAKLQAANMERSTAYYNGGWIPCDVKFPTIFKDVLIFTEEKEFHVANIDEKEWMLYDGTIIKTENVIAWQPLPEPYKPQ